MEIFSDIRYFDLNQMAQRNTSESEDERNCVSEEPKEDDEDEFSTYFTNRIDVPEDDNVIINQ